MEAFSMGHIYKVLKQVPIKDAPAYFPSRLVVEQCENVHLHYRNMRLEFTSEEFIQFYQAIKESLRPMQDYVLAKAEVKMIPLANINPFDGGHKENAEGWFICEHDQKGHEDGAEALKRALESGKKLLPIAVYWDESQNRYQRCDGFKRFWAHKLLERNEIECYVLNEYIPGIQHDMPGIL